MKVKVAAALAALALLVGVGFAAFALAGDDDSSPGAEHHPSETTTAPPANPADDPAYDVAESETVEDSVYPNVGDPGVDALHYGLDLTWDPDAARLDAVATIALRVVTTAPEFRLDFGDPLEVTAARLDGRPVETEHNGDQLVVKAAVQADERHLLVVEYAGMPAPVTAPTVRRDLPKVGWTVTDSGAVWTMQEPYGAYTWYPVNDQPADKALYDLTITAPAPFVGVANGELVSRTRIGGDTVTEWHLASPASSYLVTIAIGDYRMTRDETRSGIPITYWTPRGDTEVLTSLRYLPTAMAWLERKLGPYPFDTIGAVVVDGLSAMETETMLTIGSSAYAQSREVLVHELTHQWYGDAVSPTDWRDVWMNEGMTMYVQLVWEAEHGAGSVAQQLSYYAPYELRSRSTAGPPGAYDATMFGELNVYIGPALMWDRLRHRIGDRAFWAMVRKWPATYAGSSTDRDTYFDWIEDETGEELSPFFQAWLMGARTPG